MSAEDISIDEITPQLAATILQPGFDLFSETPVPVAYDMSRTSTDVAHNVSNIVAAKLETIVQNPDVRVTTDLSGGADSTTVSLMAAHGSHGQRKLDAFIQYDPDYPSGDLLYARRFAAYDKNIRLHELQASAAQLPFSGMHDPELQRLSCHAPYRGFAIFRREQQRLQAAAQTGDATDHIHFTGDGADALFDPDPITYISELLEADERQLAETYLFQVGRTGLYSKEFAVQAGRAGLESPREVYARIATMMSATLPGSYERVAQQLKGKQTSDQPDWLPPLGDTVQWLRPSIRERLAAQVATRAEKDYRGLTLSAFMTHHAIKDSEVAFAALQRHGEQHGITVTAPFLDPAVVGQVLSIPAYQRVHPDRYKPLLHAVLADSTGHIVTRQGKGNYSGQLYAGLLHNKSAIRSILADSLLERLGIIDTSAIRVSMEQASVGNPMRFDSLTAVLAAELYLRAQGVQAPSRPPSLSAPRQKRPSGMAARAVPTVPEQLFTVPEAVSFAPGPHGLLAILQAESGQTKIYNARGAAILRLLARTNSTPEVVRQLQQEAPTAPSEYHQRDALSVLHDARQSGILVETDTVIARSLPVYHKEQALPLEAGEVLRVRDASADQFTADELAVARQVFEASLDHQKLPPLQILNIINRRNVGAKQAITRHEAQRNMALVSAATRRYAGRAACYELSLAAVHLAHEQGRSIDWSIGVAFYPTRWHAWTEVNGEPILGPSDEPVTGIFTRIAHTAS